MKRFWTLFGTAGLAGCLSVTFTTTQSNQGEVVLNLGDLSGPCEGTATVTQEGGTVTLTRTRDGETCLITADFNAEAVDMAEVRAKVEDEIGRRGHSSISADVTLKAPLKIDVTNLKLEGFEPPSTTWSVDVDLAEQPILALAGDDLAALLTQNVSVELGKEQVSVINDAYQSGAVVPASGQIVLGSVPISWMEAQPAGGEAKLSFTIGATVTADITVEG